MGESIGMDLQFTDYNGSEAQIWSYHKKAWCELASVIDAVPLHLKSSDQAGIQGNAIFDPVGTNNYFKEALSEKGWLSNIPIPKQFSFLGTNVDFGKDGTLLEVQFSNYPFLLNNTIRSELFYKAELPLASKSTELAIIVTKAHMFPASNSTLYYEQAVKQLNELVQYNVFDVPIRLVGLFFPIGKPRDAVFTEYKSPRYSRTVVDRKNVKCRMIRGRTAGSRATPQLSGI